MWEGVVNLTRSYIAHSPGSVIDSELVDDLVLSYLHWKEACVTVRAASDRWHACAPHARRAAYVAFCAALDREEGAARIYERIVAQFDVMTPAR